MDQRCALREVPTQHCLLASLCCWVRSDGSTPSADVKSPWKSDRVFIGARRVCDCARRIWSGSGSVGGYAVISILELVIGIIELVIGHRYHRTCHQYHRTCPRYHRTCHWFHKPCHRLVVCFKLGWGGGGHGFILFYVADDMNTSLDWPLPPTHRSDTPVVSTSEWLPDQDHLHRSQ